MMKKPRKTSSSRAPIARAVSFSGFSARDEIPRADADDCWYNRRDELRFRRQLTRDVNQLAGDIDEAAAEDTIAAANLYKVIGIETLITRGLSEQVDEERRMHCKAVLEEQRFQRQRGIRDPEKLSKVSRLSSCWSKERARKLATGINELLHDVVLPK